MKRFLKRLQRRRPKPLTTRRKVLYAVLAALPILCIFTFGNRGLLNRLRLENRADELRAQVYAERRVTDSVRAEIARITTDTAAIERLAREHYGMARPGETIYRIEE